MSIKPAFTAVSSITIGCYCKDCLATQLSSPRSQEVVFSAPFLRETLPLPYRYHATLLPRMPTKPPSRPLKLLYDFMSRKLSTFL